MWRTSCGWCRVGVCRCSPQWVRDYVKERGGLERVLNQHRTLRGKLADIHEALPNFGLNGGDAVAQIRGMLDDLGDASKQLAEAKADHARLRGMAEWKRGEEHESMMEVWSKDVLVTVRFNDLRDYSKVGQAKSVIAKAFGVWPYAEAEGGEA